MFEPNNTTSDPAQKYRYPFIAHEILKSGAKFVLDYFFDPPKESSFSTEAKDESTATTEPADHKLHTTEALDGYIADFLESQASANPVLAGYFSSIVSSFLQHRRLQIADYFFVQRRRLMDLLITKCLNPSIGQLLSSLLLLCSAGEFDDEDDGGSVADFTAERCAIYRELLAKFAASESLELRVAIAEIFRQFAENSWRSSLGGKVIEEVLFADSKLLEQISADLLLEGSSFKSRLRRKASLQFINEIVALLVKDKKPGPVLVGMTGDHQRLKRSMASAKYLEKLLGQPLGISGILGDILQKAAAAFGKLAFSKRVSPSGSEVWTIDPVAVQLVDLIDQIICLRLVPPKETLVEIGFLRTMLATYLKVPDFTLLHVSVGALIGRLLDADLDKDSYYQPLFDEVDHRNPAHRKRSLSNLSQRLPSAVESWQKQPARRERPAVDQSRQPPARKGSSVHEQ